MKPLISCPPEPLQICPKSKFFFYSDGGDTIDFRVSTHDEFVYTEWSSCLCHADPAKRKVMCCVAEVEWTERAERFRDVQEWLENHGGLQWITWSIRFGFRAADAEHQARRWRAAGNEKA